MVVSQKPHPLSAGFRCRLCRCESRETRMQCLSCGALVSMCPASDLALREERTPRKTAIVRDVAPQVDKIDPDMASTIALSDVTVEELIRIETGIEPFDRVVGGGLVMPSAVLLGGNPGVGKSRLLLQVLAKLTSKHRKAIYVCGEESSSQVAARARELELSGDWQRSLLLANTVVIEDIEATIKRYRPAFVVVDSINVMRMRSIDGLPGGNAQMIAVSKRLHEIARHHDLICFLVAQMNKAGSYCGAKAVEHLVDATFSLAKLAPPRVRFWSPNGKNRYGDTSERGYFEMTERGLRPVCNREPKPDRVATRKKKTP